ncbi:MAG: cupin domain-containing protein [Lachnospiraceae bacterium]|nr:cupin domain-containing protein [Lachnospiraceae bacterium]
MNQNATMGMRIKALRKEKKYTLKQLAEESGLSIGFLSQLERGMSSIAVDSLARIASILGVSLSTFFSDAQVISEDPVSRSLELHWNSDGPEIAQALLSKDLYGFDILPRIFQLMPSADTSGDQGAIHRHTGEEFIYVLEGVVTVYHNDREYTLYPGDSIQIHSNTPHNWVNRTNRIARLLSVSYPNPFREEREHATTTEKND